MVAEEVLDGYGKFVFVELGFVAESVGYFMIQKVAYPQIPSPVDVLIS
jgi:hypothetical protein